MDAAMPAPGAPEGAPADTNYTPTSGEEVFSALLHGLSERDAALVDQSLRRARQATRDADERGESTPEPIW